MAEPAAAADAIPNSAAVVPKNLFGSVFGGLFNGAVSTNEFLFQGVAGEPSIAWFLRLMTAAFCFPAMFGSLYRAGHTLLSVLTGNHQELKFGGSLRPMSPFSYMSSEEMDHFLRDNGLWTMVDTAHRHIIQWWSTGGRAQRFTSDAIGQQLVWLRLMVRSFLGFKRDPGGLYMCFKHATSRPQESTLGLRIAQRPEDDRAYGPHGPLNYYDRAWRVFVEQCALLSARISDSTNESSLLSSAAEPVDPLPVRQCKAMVATFLKMAEQASKKAQGKQGSPQVYEGDGSLKCGLTPDNFAAPNVDSDGFDYLCLLWASDPDWSMQLQARCHQAPTTLEVAPFFKGRTAQEPPSRQEAHIVRALFELHTSQLSTVLQKSSKRWQDPLNFKPIKSIVEWRQQQCAGPARDFLTLFPKDNRDMVGLGSSLTPEQRSAHGFDPPNPNPDHHTPQQAAPVPPAVVMATPPPLVKEKKPKAVRARRAAPPSMDGDGSKAPRVKRRPKKSLRQQQQQGQGHLALDMTPGQLFTVPPRGHVPGLEYTPGQEMMQDQHEPEPLPSPLMITAQQSRDARRFERSVLRQRTRMAVRSNVFYSWTTGCRVLNLYCQSGTPFASMMCNDGFARTLRDELSMMLPPAPSTPPALMDDLFRIISSHWSLQALFLTGANPTACLAVGRPPFQLAQACVPANLADQQALEQLIRDPSTLEKMVSAEPFRQKPHRIMRALLGPMHKLKDSQVLVDMFNTMYCPDDASDPESGHSILLALWPRMASALLEISMAWLNDWSVVAGEPLGSLAEQEWDHMYTPESVQRLLDQLASIAAAHPANMETIEALEPVVDIDSTASLITEELLDCGQLPPPAPPTPRHPTKQMAPPASMTCDPREPCSSIPRPDSQDLLRHLMPSLFPVDSDGSFYGY